MAGANPAHADATVLVGLATPSAPHPTIAVSWGVARRMVGFEIEYASATRTTGTTPSVGTIGVNLLVQLPEAVNGIRWYATGGLGIHAQSWNGGGTYGSSRSIGGGAKVPLAGPLKVRLDYRFFFFSAEEHERPPLYFHSHRISGGLTLEF
jgi:hypothetical protein